ncbi:MAG: NAD-dependent epimerase/dehydratase family protein [Rhodobacteraceae bacterium]|nr:NAD-dependent epimerase/dehydratase family protein [Paracoccaceae bacterium]
MSDLSASSRPFRTALIGAGYIADWHAAALKSVSNAQLSAVVDPSPAAAAALGAAHNVPTFASVEEMIAADVADAAHILTPPHLHKEIALTCFAGGLHCLVEKPVALSADDTRTMADAAQKAGMIFCAGHNFLGVPGYVRLKDKLRAGELGRVSSVQVDWAFPLGPLRSGPYGIWLMREPKNLLLELGPHAYAFAIDLFGPLEVLSLQLGQPVTLPGGGIRHQSWRILARAGAVDVTINLSLAETHDDRSLTVRGSSAMARLDYANDVLTLARTSTADLILNPLLNQLGASARHLREGVVNATRQTLSLNRKSPYGLSFAGAAQAFYDGLAAGEADPRFGAEAAVDVMQAIDDTLGFMPNLPAPRVALGTPKPDVMVIGGTGFIGRNLTRALVAHGHDVRVLSRGRTGPFGDIADHVETVPVSLSDTEALTEAMRGMKAVFNLAKSMDDSWEAALKNDVGTATAIANAAMDAGVGRLIYTGTIASYDMSDPDETITEDTAFGDMSARNIYARSKAECERQLIALHNDMGLPLTIARPGIVVGPGGPLQHWGIGRWHGAGAVKLWGDGNNIPPFVLSDDISSGLIAMMDHEDAIGRSFNLIGEPMLTGRGYFAAIHQRMGAKLSVGSGSLGTMWAADGAKYVLKKHVLKRADAQRPSLADWRSRGHLSPFDNRLPKALLGWQPEQSYEAFLRRAIDEAGLFGI